VREWFSVNSQNFIHGTIVRDLNELQFAFYFSMKEEKIMQPLLCVALNISVVWSAIHTEKVC
jgi:hypothetical protein